MNGSCISRLISLKWQARQRIADTVATPERIVRSRTDATVELFYKWYPDTPATTKFLCVVVKALPDDQFIITSCYAGAVQRGEVLWEKK